jgi:hypothetical protein
MEDGLPACFLAAARCMRRQQPGRPPSRTSVFLSATSAPLRFNFGFQTKRGAAEDAEKDAEWKIVGPGFPNIISSDSIPTTIE